MKWTDSLVLKFCVITGMFALVYGINNALTPWLLMVPGAHLVHIPSGIKLVLVLIFEMTGAISVATVSLLAGLLFFFPDQPWVSVELALVNALAPFLTVAWLISEDGIDRWLETLRPKKIMLMGVVYSALNSSLNQGRTQRGGRMMGVCASRLRPTQSPPWRSNCSSCSG